MKTLNDYINEKFQVGKQTLTRISKLKQKVKTRRQLLNAVKKRITNMTGTTLNLTDIDISEMNSLSDLFIDIFTPALSSIYDNIKCINVSGWDTSNVTHMTHLFKGLPKLEKIIGIEDWDTSNVMIMLGMFNRCENIETIDTSNWDMSKVERIDFMFNECYKLKNIIGIDKWKTKSLESTNNAFMYCEELYQLDLSGWDVSKLKYAKGMFLKCANLTSIGDISNWKPDKLVHSDLMLYGTKVDDIPHDIRVKLKLIPE